MDVKRDIPSEYGDNKIVLMVRDPWTLFTYWEIRPDVERAARESFEREGLSVSRSVLRVYDVTGKAPRPVSFFDVDLCYGAVNWYLNNMSPGREWMIDIGLISSSGEFITLARSNVVKTPADRMSETSDDKWVCPEELYYKMFAAAGGYDTNMSSLEMREMIERHLKSWRSSGGGVTSGMFSSGAL
jgi:hypothetical protein